MVRRDGTEVTTGITEAGRRPRVVWREMDAMDVFADLESLVFVITAFEVPSMTVTSPENSFAQYTRLFAEL